MCNFLTTCGANRKIVRSNCSSAIEANKKVECGSYYLQLEIENSTFDHKKKLPSCELLYDDIF